MVLLGNLCKNRSLPSLLPRTSSHRTLGFISCKIGVNLLGDRKSKVNNVDKSTLRNNTAGLFAPGCGAAGMPARGSYVF